MRSTCLGILNKRADTNRVKTQCFLRKRLWKGPTPRFVTECSGIFQPIDAPRFGLLSDAPTTIANWTLPNLR